MGPTFASLRESDQFPRLRDSEVVDEDPRRKENLWGLPWSPVLRSVEKLRLG